MKPWNTKLKKFLEDNGINCTPKYIETGSCRGQWRLDGKGQTWYGNADLQAKLTAMGFTDHDGNPLNDHSGNGGAFYVFTRFARTNEFLLP